MISEYHLHPSSMFPTNTKYWHLGMKHYRRNDTFDAAIFMQTEYTYDKNNGLYKIMPIVEAHALAYWMIQNGVCKEVVVSTITKDFFQHTKKT